MGGFTAASDNWFRLHGPRMGEMEPRTWEVWGTASTDRPSFSGIHGLGGNILGVFWRHGHSSWDFGRARKHTARDIRARSNVHGAIEVWLQFYQYDWPDENRPGIRTARL